MKKLCFAFAVIILMSSSACVSKKEYQTMQARLLKDNELANQQLGKCGKSLNEKIKELEALQAEYDNLASKFEINESMLSDRTNQIDYLKKQIEDLKVIYDKQLTQVGDLTVLSQSANDNIKETLSQLEQKDKYINLLQAAKTKADSINLALAVNLKGVLEEGISDRDVEIKVDKTVVFVNLSDKMLFKSGSSNLTTRADEVLGKIAKIIESRPDLEVMVEGYTDNVPIKNSCIQDNWDLSVKRATSVVRALQNNHNIDPNRLIAAGRGEYNALASNDTASGRSINRRTRIIILPKLNQFYDLLNPNKVPD